MTIALLGVKYPFRQPVSMSLNNEIQGVFYLSMQTLIRDTGDTVISDQKSVIWGTEVDGLRTIVRTVFLFIVWPPFLIKSTLETYDKLI